eukprot:TRINITY_DN4129_c0_g1_i3.p1 TRINITY_DN4129_c0_g1~~TRINITY_DN4129_c0_g1_i3.p1  ORF type:complete len:247 (-),score=40.52 TRINITY_DN4129_c0_g1_i3:208-948(-)
MIFVTLHDILHHGKMALSAHMSGRWASLLVCGYFLVGVFVTYGIHSLSHWIEFRGVEEDIGIDLDKPKHAPVQFALDHTEDQYGYKTNKKILEDNTQTLKVASFSTSVALVLHNFPEGISTFASSLVDFKLGVSLAFAIGIHNIAEGVCVALPMYYATKSKLKAFLWTLLAAISEPLGALVGFLISSVWNDIAYGVVLAVVGGIMTYVSVKELLPTAHKYDPDDTNTTFSLISGMLVIFASISLVQ